jgi:Ulp1 family protease
MSEVFTIDLTLDEKIEEEYNEALSYYDSLKHTRKPLPYIDPCDYKNLRLYVKGKAIPSKNEDSFYRFDFTQCFNDDIINSYINLLKQKTNEKNILLNTYFSDILIRQYDKSNKNFKKFYNTLNQERNFETAHKFYIPILIHNPNHWSLIIVNTMEHTIEWIDSFYTIIIEEVEIYIKRIKQFFKELIKFRRGKEGKFIIKIIYTKYKQENDYDCGVYMCKYIDLLSREKFHYINKNDIVYYRALIGIEIMKEKLIDI